MVIVLAALSSALQFTVRAGSLLAVGTLLVAGGFGSPFAALSAAPSPASASGTVLVEQLGRSAQAPDAELVKQPGRSARAPDAESAEVVTTEAAEAPSVAPTAPGTPAPTTAPVIPAPTTDPTAPVTAGETTPSSPARGSTANAAHPAGDPSSAGVPDTCPADWFCYPRLGVAGPIVPYSDCSGSTDIRGAIVSFTCLSSRSSTYLIGHAYTQFGNITRWAAGDIVQANGVRYTVTGAITDRSCAAPSLPLARLSMQTSLGPSTCGPVLVVQAR